jgi:PAS domain S-box-containing protein
MGETSGTMNAPVPINEPNRIAALRDYGILDTPAESDFDEITALAAEICGTPIALISLVDESRQWFKSKVGVSIMETPRDVAFCAHAIAGNEILMVPDALEDPRFAQNPLVVGDPEIRFYAGAPLISEDGLNLGTLCVIDHEPRKLTDLQRHALRVLGRQVVTQMRLRRDLRALQSSEAARFKVTENQAIILDALPANIALIDSSGTIIAVNESWRNFAAANGLHARGSVGDNYISVCESASGPNSEEAASVADAVRDLLAGRIPGFEIEYPCHSPTEKRWFRLMVTPLREGMQAGALVMHLHITKRKQAELRLERLNRLYQVLSGINEMIVRVTDQGELLDEACRIAVGLGLFRVAAVFSCAAPGTPPAVLTHAGPEDGCFAEVLATMPWEVLCHASINTASTGTCDVSNDLSDDPSLPLFREVALRCGFCSVAAFPLKRQNSVFGVLALYAGEAGYFQADEIKLLAAIAEDLSFAADALQNEKHRLETEAALRVSEANMATAQRISHLGSWEFMLNSVEDFSVNPLHWSDEMYRIAGFKPGAVKVTSELYFRLTHPEDRESVRQAADQAIHHCRKLSIIHRLVRPDGNERTVHLTARTFTDEHTGRPLRMVGTAHDITEQRLAETTLRDSEQRFRQLAENIHEVIWILNPATRQILYISPAYEKIWGRTCESLYVSPQDWMEAIHPDDREAVNQAFADHPTGEFNEVYRILHTDGSLRWIHDRGYSVRNEQGEIYRIVGTAEDITGRRLAEEKLREHATLLDKAQDAILVRDLDHRIHFWNLSAERLFGWTASEAIGRSAEDLLYPSPEHYQAANAAALENGEWLGELEQTTRSGKLITVEARWTLVRDDQGRPKSILAINTDITGRKLLEQQFLRAQRMECIGTLAGGIAHDLNNVLAPIMMSIDILKLSVTDPRSLEILTLIETSARRGADMVGQVLSFARGVEGRRIRIDIQPLIRDLVKIADDTFPKNILTRTEIEAHLWPTDADPTQLHQVLINLCVNARDAMPGGGNIIIRASNAAIDAHYAAMNIEAQAGKHVCIEVEDTGTGMSRETIDSIFDPFYTTKEIGAGTGLGLSTALAIVKGHGGFIRVYSDPGAGSRFRIYLPAADTDAPTSVLETNSILPRGDGEIVLVVDDEPSIRHITRQTLEAFGYSVLVAADGAEAVSTFVEYREHIAVVLTDMMMPIMDGPSLIKILRRLDPAVRIIGASGIASNDQIARSLQAGVKHFLSKPYTAKTLLLTVHAILTEGPAGGGAGHTDAGANV